MVLLYKKNDSLVLLHSLLFTLRCVSILKWLGLLQMRSRELNGNFHFWLLPPSLMCMEGFIFAGFIIMKCFTHNNEELLSLFCSYDQRWFFPCLNYLVCFTLPASYNFHFPPNNKKNNNFWGFWYLSVFIRLALKYESLVALPSSTSAKHKGTLSIGSMWTTGMLCTLLCILICKYLPTWFQC